MLHDKAFWSFQDTAVRANALCVFNQPRPPLALGSKHVVVHVGTCLSGSSWCAASADHALAGGAREQQER